MADKLPVVQELSVPALPPKCQQEAAQLAALPPWRWACMWLWLPAEGAGGRLHGYPSLQDPGDGLQLPLLFRASQEGLTGE